MFEPGNTFLKAPNIFMIGSVVVLATSSWARAVQLPISGTPTCLAPWAVMRPTLDNRPRKLSATVASFSIKGVSRPPFLWWTCSGNFLPLGV